VKFVNKKILWAVICVAALIGCNAFAASQIKDPYVGAIALEYPSGRILFNDGSDNVSYPASCTKIMTARLLLKAVHSGRVSMSDRIVQTSRSAQEEPSKIDLNPGESLTIRDALIALMVKSANDISVAVAEKLSGSVEAFVAEMNVEAVKLGMTNTIYASPNGLPPPKKNEGKKRVNTRGFDISTPYDLAKLAIATIKEYPEILKFSSMVYATVPGKGGKSLSLRNHNNLLWKKGFVNRDVDGLKTGYIKAGGSSVVITAKRRNKRVVVVVTGSTSAKTRDTQAGQIVKNALDAIDW
jgi:D-alanyl-D-alanine carboxypeptidase